MAENSKNSEKLSTTSSDLGSSCCDNDADLSSDVKDKSDDAASAAGSTSLTIDSLEEEEEEEVKEQQRIEVPIAAIIHSEMQKYSSSKDGWYLHEQKETPARPKTLCRVPEVGVPSKCEGDKSSESKPPGNNELEDGDGHSADKQQTKCRTSSEERDEDEQTTTKCEKAESESLVSSATLRETPAASKELAHKIGDFQPSTASRTDSEPRVISEDHEDKLILRKSRSLTNESSTDPSPKPSRRSGIPRRKNSTQSMITVLSSGRSTPQNSPARVRRSLTLDSAGDYDLPKWTSASPSRTSPRSFPTSPVKAPSKLRRSASQCECSSSSAVSCPPVALSRDNISSRLRFEKHHHDHCRMESPGTYLTPSQRMDLTLKELKAQVKELSKQLEHKDREVEDLQRLMVEEKLRIQQDLREELEEANESAEAARKELASLQEAHTESLKKGATLQQQLDEVKKAMRNKLAESEQIFLEMYNKGRQSAMFEHEEEEEIRRKGGRSQESTEKELYHKLVKTQAELAKWQAIQRHESYHTMPIPGTEAETTLRFLKDSVFHYLTTDKSASDEHLRAIVRILHFSDDQRERIAHAIIMKRNKSGW